MSWEDLADAIKANFETTYPGTTFTRSMFYEFADALVDYGATHWSGATSPKMHAVFKVTGKLIVIQGVDVANIFDTSFVITGIWLYRKTAGVSGSTIVDIHKNGTTIYTTQANRPTIAYNDADHKVDATLPDVVAVNAGDVLTMDIDQVETGSPEDLVVVIEGGN